MPTLASIHSSQATISVEVRPARPGTGSGMDVSTDSMSGLVLDHSRVHLLLSPHSRCLSQASKALAGSRACPHRWGMPLLVSLLNMHAVCDILSSMWQLLSLETTLAGLQQCFQRPAPLHPCLWPPAARMLDLVAPLASMVQKYGRLLQGKCYTTKRQPPLKSTGIW